MTRKRHKPKRSAMHPNPHTLAQMDTREKVFWAYFELGDDRTLHKVAKKVGKPVDTINRWSAAGKWSERIAKIAENIRRSNEAEVQRQSREVLDQGKKIAQAMVAELLERFREFKKEGILPDFDYKDLREFLKLQLQMHGFLIPPGMQTNVNLNQQTQVINPLQIQQETDSTKMLRDMLTKANPTIREHILGLIEEVDKESESQNENQKKE